MLRPFRDALLLILFWIICFDFHRILFSINHWSKFAKVGFGEWLMAFVYSFRLDLATACALTALPFIARLFAHYGNWKGNHRIFRIILMTLLVILVCVQAGEIVAYGEWNHKLTSRVFMHLSNPDEVARTASYGMVFWFLLYAIIELAFGWWLDKKLFKLTSRVFMHLSNPDEVARTASYGMVFWFLLYAIIELAFGWWLDKKLFK